MDSPKMFMNDNNENMDQISLKLLAYLQGELGDTGIGYKSHPEKLEGGYETLTYRFQLNGGPEHMGSGYSLHRKRPYLALSTEGKRSGNSHKRAHRNPGGSSGIGVS